MQTRQSSAGAHLDSHTAPMVQAAVDGAKGALAQKGAQQEPLKGATGLAGRDLHLAEGLQAGGGTLQHTATACGQGSLLPSEFGRKACHESSSRPI